MMRSFVLMVSLSLLACTGNGDGQCQRAEDCGPNPGAACARRCSDSSNACVFVCREFQCVMRGCPDDVDAGTPDAAVASAHAEGESCDDGLGCVTGLVCTGVGDPCPTYPNCKVCYVPCGPGGVCPPGYQTCIPFYGQGGNVCIH